MDRSNPITTDTEDSRGGRERERERELGSGPPPASSSSFDPRRYRAQAKLLDGRSIVLRAIRPEDKEGLRKGFQRLSERSVYLRFFQAKKDLTEQELRYFTELDFETHVGLLAVTVGKEGRGVGVGRYILEPGTGAAEIAFVVDDAHQGLGVGTLLLQHLAAIARGQGIEKFHAYVMFDNRQMLEVFEHAGFPLERRLQGNVIQVTLLL